MLRRLSLRFVPDGFTLERISCSPGKITLMVRSQAAASACPDCQAMSRRVHSRYRRRVADLPLSGQSVELILAVRRFRCPAVLCGRQIFAERFASDILASSARRTSRLETLVHHLGLALGGRPGSSLARRVGLPISNDTLLRVIRRQTRPARAETKGGLIEGRMELHSERVALHPGQGVSAFGQWRPPSGCPVPASQIGGWEMLFSLITWRKLQHCCSALKVSQPP